MDHLTMTPAAPGQWALQYDNAPNIMPAPVVGFVAAVVNVGRDNDQQEVHVTPVVVCCGQVYAYGADNMHTHGSYTVVPVAPPAWLER